MKIYRGKILFVCAAALFIFSACGSAATGTPGDVLTASVTAGTGLTAFTYHGSTAYEANFGAAGLVISGAQSSAAAGYQITTYTWEQISGPSATITSDTTSQTLTFTAPAMTAILSRSDEYRWQPLPISRESTVMTFRLTVGDGQGNTSITTQDIYLFDDGYEPKTTTGLGNVGVGEKVYISGPKYKANSSTASTTVTDWAWVLTAPAGSAAVLASANTQITSFIPDVSGSYTIAYTSVSAGASSAITVTASDYVGVGTVAGTSPDWNIGQCGACHDGSVEPNVLTSWQGTGHSSVFEQVIGYYKNYAPAPYCWECHTVGYDTDSTAAENSGFSSLVTSESYSFPSAGTTWAQFTSDESTLTVKTNVQCENCHGPGGTHTGTYSNWDAGVCGKCHPQNMEWRESAHNSTGVVGTAGRYQLTSWWSAPCARCHSSGGFAQEAAGETVTAQTSQDFLVACQACHDPHSVSADSTTGSTSISGNDSTQLRLKGTTTMKDDAHTSVAAGKAAVCYECHDGFYAYNEDDCDSNGDGTADAICTSVDQAATQYFRMPHANTQSFALQGVGAITAFSNSAYDFVLTENSWHESALFTLKNGTGDSSQSDVNNKCVTCHMGTAPGETESGYRLVGGHTWKMTNGSTEFISSCTGCHPGLGSFNRTARADYDGDGAVEGVQGEISGLLLALTTKLLAIYSTNISGGTTADASGVITVAALSYKNQAAQNAAPIDYRRAMYNYNVIARDGSLGIHNTAFAVQLIQRTYTAISTMNSGNSFQTDYPNAILR